MTVKVHQEICEAMAVEAQTRIGSEGTSLLFIAIVAGIGGLEPWTIVQHADSMTKS